MQIKILGTGAAEGWPGVFCGCEACRKIRELGGKNIRSRASLQIGPCHKIDLPPDAWYHSAVRGADLTNLEYLFITHSHQDHLALKQLEFLAPPFAHCRPAPLKLYGSDAVLAVTRAHLEEIAGKSTLLIEAEPFTPIDAQQFSFTPIIASHKPDELCFNYVVSSQDRTILYACDTGWYPDETWAFLETLRLDCVIAECTNGPVPGGVYHLDFEYLYRMKQRLEAAGAFDGGVFVATHFSHNINLTHDELEQTLEAHGIQAAYDGMEFLV